MLVPVVSSCDTPIHEGSFGLSQLKQNNRKDLLGRLALQLVTLGQEIERWVLWLACLGLCLCPSIAEAAVVAAVVRGFGCHLTLDDRFTCASRLGFLDCNSNPIRCAV